MQIVLREERGHYMDGGQLVLNGGSLCAGAVMGGQSASQLTSGQRIYAGLSSCQISRSGARDPNGQK